MSNHRAIRASLAMLAASLAVGSARTAGVTFERVYPLKPNEGVFAYARISPTGRQLAYASETPNPAGRGIIQTVTVVDLKDQRVLFTEPGIDAYFSNDSQRMIFLSFANGRHTVAIRN